MGGGVYTLTLTPTHTSQSQITDIWIRIKDARRSVAADRGEPAAAIRAPRGLPGARTSCTKLAENLNGMFSGF